MARRFQKFISILCALALLAVSILTAMAEEEILPDAGGEENLLRTTAEEQEEQEESSEPEQLPVQEHLPVREVSPVQESSPDEEEPSEKETQPAQESVPEEEEPSGQEPGSAQEGFPDEDEPPVQLELPAQESTPDTEEPSGQEAAPAQENPQGQEPTPVQEQTTVQESSPAQESAPDSEQPSAPEEPSPEQEKPQEPSSGGEDAPAQEDLPAQEEDSGLRFNGTVSGTFAEGEPFTVVYHSGADGKVAFTLTLRNGTDAEFFADETAVSAEETRMTEDGATEIVYPVSVQSGRDYTIRMTAAAGVSFSLNAGPYRPETQQPAGEAEQQEEAEHPSEENEEEGTEEHPAEPADEEEELPGTRGWITAEPAEYRAGDTIVLHGFTDPETENTFSWMCSRDGETWEKQDYGRELSVGVTEENEGMLFCFRFGEDALSEPYTIAAVPEAEDTPETEQDADTPDGTTPEEPAEPEDAEGEDPDAAEEAETPETERDIAINVTFDTPNPVIGDTAHFSAVLTGYDQLTYTLQWQYSPDQTEWTDLPGETGETMDIVVTEENNTVFWRIVVDVEEDREA